MNKPILTSCLCCLALALISLQVNLHMAAMFTISALILTVMLRVKR